MNLLIQKIGDGWDVSISMDEDEKRAILNKDESVAGPNAYALFHIIGAVCIRLARQFDQDAGVDSTQLLGAFVEGLCSGEMPGETFTSSLDPGNIQIRRIMPEDGDRLQGR